VGNATEKLAHSAWKRTKYCCVLNRWIICSRYCKLYTGVLINP